MKPLGANRNHQAMILEYRSFEEFNFLSDTELMELDEFLKSYAELIYCCFSQKQNSESKVVPLNHQPIKLKAA